MELFAALVGQVAATAAPTVDAGAAFAAPGFGVSPGAKGPPLLPSTPASHLLLAFLRSSVAATPTALALLLEQHPLPNPSIHPLFPSATLPARFSCLNPALLIPHFYRKPSELAPLTCVRMAALAEAAGLPAGALSVLTGEGSPAGASLSAHGGLDKVTFTGSVPTGQVWKTIATMLLCIAVCVVTVGVVF